MGASTSSIIAARDPFLLSSCCVLAWQSMRGDRRRSSTSHVSGIRLTPSEMWLSACVRRNETPPLGPRETFRAIHRGLGRRSMPGSRRSGTRKPGRVLLPFFRTWLLHMLRAGESLSGEQSNGPWPGRNALDRVHSSPRNSSRRCRIRAEAAVTSLPARHQGTCDRRGSPEFGQ